MALLSWITPRTMVCPIWLYPTHCNPILGFRKPSLRYIYLRIYRFIANKIGDFGLALVEKLPTSYLANSEVSSIMKLRLPIKLLITKLQSNLNKFLWNLLVNKTRDLYLSIDWKLCQINLSELQNRLTTAVIKSD